MIYSRIHTRRGRGSGAKNTGRDAFPTRPRDRDENEKSACGRVIRIPIMRTLRKKSLPKKIQAGSKNFLQEETEGDHWRDVPADHGR